MSRQNIINLFVCLLLGAGFLTAILRISSRVTSIAAGKSADGSGYKCIYEGVSYNIGDLLPTHNKCWHCLCCQGFIEPNLAFCAPIECPPIPSTACEIVHQEDKCCPKYYNCNVHTAYRTTGVAATVTLKPKGCHSCVQKYFKHYETKHCRPVYDKGCECPRAFDCPDLPEAGNTTHCKYKGRTYTEGERLPTANPCDVCRCRRDRSSSTLAILCVVMTCGYVSNTPVDEKNCYDVFEEGRCCPSTVKCNGSSTSGNSGEVEPACEFEGATYHLGQRMYSKEDPCLVCLCDKGFRDKNSSSCHFRDCDLENKMAKFIKGCIPIYHERTCCPVGFHCPDDFEGRTPVTLSKGVAINESDPLSYCTFNAKNFSIGAQFEIIHPRRCVTCICLTPPDFTCVHKDC